jgi:hypothetical protein
MNPLQPLFRTMARWSVATQLYAGFGAVLCLMALLGALSMWALHRVEPAGREPGRKVDALRRASFGDAGGPAGGARFRGQAQPHADRSYHAEYEDKIAVAQKKVAQELEAIWNCYVAPEEREKGDKLRKDLGRLSEVQCAGRGLGRDKKQQDAADISDGAATMAVDEALGAADEH